MAAKKKDPVETGAADMSGMTISNPNHLKAVYANNFAVSATMTDFTIYFMEVVQMPGEKDSVQEVKATVTLPMLAVGGLMQAMQQVANQANMVMKQQQLKAQSGAK